MNYEFHPEAERELDEAALRYESEVPGLGHRFGDEVERVVQLLLEHPELGSRLDNDLRHFILRRFPFSIVYAAARISFTSSLSRTAAVSLAIGNCESRTANKRLQARRSKECAPETPK